MSTTTTTTSDQSRPASTGSTRRASLRRVLPVLGFLAGALLWWPVGFLGVRPWPHLPLDVFAGDTLFLGATAAAASVSLLVRSPWPRLLVVVLASGLGWLLDTPTGRYPHEQAVLAVLLGGAALVGILLGARGAKGPLAAATVLAVVAGLSPATWPRGLALALALALPFAVAIWQRVAPTLLSLVRLVLTWLVFALLARALSYGWDLVRPGAGGVPVGQQARTVADAAWDFARTQWWTHSQALVSSSTRWFVTAAVLAVVIVVLRSGRGVLRRRSSSSSSSAD